MTITESDTINEVHRSAVVPSATDLMVPPSVPGTAGRRELVGNVAIPLSRALPRRLLGVWAHPDDEAYLSAGLMGRVIDSGGQVTLVTATRGELGSEDPELAGSDAFAAHREAELRSSLGELGVTDVRVLGLPDGGCVATESEMAVAALIGCIDELRPDAIVTFGPDGITGHPDHAQVSAWTTSAWWARRTGTELLYATMTSDFAREYGAMHDELGLFAEHRHGRPATVPQAGVALECSLNRTELVRKRAALARHGSQTDGLAQAVGEQTYFSWWRRETFRTPTASELAGQMAPRADTGPDQRDDS